MTEQEQQKAGGRQATRTEPFKRITIEIPEEDWKYITDKSRTNRTEWIRRAIKREREREEQGNVTDATTALDLHMR